MISLTCSISGSTCSSSPSDAASAQCRSSRTIPSGSRMAEHRRAVSAAANIRSLNSRPCSWSSISRSVCSTGSDISCARYG